MKTKIVYISTLLASTLTFGSCHNNKAETLANHEVAELSQLLNLLSAEALTYMAIGGVFYTLGTIFYASKRIPYGHFIWHLFVLGGSVSHYFMIYSIV